MQTQTADGLSYLAFDNMAALPGLRHGVSLRWQRVAETENTHTTGAFEFDFSSRAPDRMRANLKRFCQTLGLSAEKTVVASQVHGCDVGVISKPGQTIPPLDALCTKIPDVSLVLRGADCPLVLIYDPVVPAVGIAHAGWRGTVHKIVLCLIETMTGQLG
jgi:copper oxidase (laccase) domain-containing protein